MSPVNVYKEAYRRALEDPEGFWAERAATLHWERRWDRVLDASRAPFYRWFVGGRINTCYNALDRHIEQGRGEQAALIYDSPVTGAVARLSYRELRARVAKLAGALKAQGIARSALSGVRWFRRARARQAHRRRASAHGDLRILRHRRPAGDSVQTAAR